MPEETTATPNPTSPTKSGNKTLMIVGIIVLLLVLAGVGYFVFGKNLTGSKTSNSTDSSKKTETSNTSSKTSIKDLIFKRKNVTCSVKYPEGSATVYVSDKKFYGEFTTTADGKTTKGYILQDGEYSYLWSDESTDGFKVKLTEEDKANTPSALDLQEEGDVNCSNWSVDKSKLTAPTNINFADFTPPAITN